MNIKTGIWILILVTGLLKLFYKMPAPMQHMLGVFGGFNYQVDDLHGE